MCDYISFTLVLLYVAIRIGFERPSYTYTEPRFEEFIDSSYVRSPGPVYLVKENNVTSEQTFIVTIQVSSAVPPGRNIQPATIGSDYDLGDRFTTTFTFIFRATSLRLNFPFALYSDDVPEPTEAFTATASPSDVFPQLPDGSVEVYPSFLNPINLTLQTFIVIEDDDSK